MQRGRYTYLAALTAALAFVGWSGRPPQAAGIPGWQDQTFNTTATGSASVDANGVWTIKGAGADTWEHDDQFHIVYKPLKGDGSVTTKLLSADEGNEYSKCGVMMRDDLTTNKAAADIQIHMTTGHGGELLIRGLDDPMDGASGLGATRMSKDFKMGDTPLFPRQFPMWLKLERRGSGVTAYARAGDTDPWIPVSRSEQLALKDQVVAGCFVCSHSDPDLLTATFDGKSTDVSNTLLKPEQAYPMQPSPVTVTGGDNSVLLTWAPVDHLGHPADGYTVYKAAVGDTAFTKLADLTGDKTSYLDTTIKNGDEALYRVTTIVNVGGQKLESRQFVVDSTTTLGLYHVTGAPNPPIKIGNTQFNANVLDGGGQRSHTDTPGSASIDANGVVTLKGSGWDFYDTADGGEELMTPIHGDFTFTARVLGIPTNTDGTDANEFAKFGIAVRANTLSESPYAGMFITPQHGIRVPHRREFSNGWSDDVAPNEDTPTFPIYFRVQRQGNTLKFSTSADGNTFKPYGMPDTYMPPILDTDAYVGLMGSSHDTSAVSQAKFDKISLTTP